MKERNEALELIQKAQDCYCKNDKEGYLQALGQAAKKDPYYSEPSIMMGFHHFKEREWQKARENLEKALQLDYLIDNNEEMAEKIYITLGKVYQMQGKKELSLQIYKAFAGLFPHSPSSEKLFLQIYSRHPDVEKCFSCFRKGYNQLLAKNCDDALAHFNEALLIISTYSWLHYFIGRTWASLGHNEEAAASYLKALEIDEHFIFHYALHTVYSALHKEQDAERSLGRALELNPFYHLVLLSRETAMRRFQIQDGTSPLCEAAPAPAAPACEGQAEKAAARDREAAGKEIQELLACKLDEFRRYLDEVFSELKVRARKELNALLDEEVSQAKAQLQILKAEGEIQEESMIIRIRSKMDEICSGYGKRAEENTGTLLARLSHEGESLLSEIEAERRGFQEILKEAAHLREAPREIEAAPEEPPAPLLEKPAKKKKKK